MGALYLKLLDERIETTGLPYARFMDDWVILAPSRWKLQAAIRLVNETLAELKLQQHPDKTFIGRVSRGFDILGYLFTPARLEVAPRAVERCVERVSRLYERGANLVRIGVYVRCWQRWAKSGLREDGEKRVRASVGLREPLTWSRRGAPMAITSAVAGVCGTNGRRRLHRFHSPQSRGLMARGQRRLMLQ